MALDFEKYTYTFTTANQDPVRVAPPTWLETTQMVAAELVPSMAGAIVGAAVGGLPGGAAGGAGGSALGNVWSQNLRRDMGFQDELRPGELIAATATGVIPLTNIAKAGVAAKTAIRAAEGAGIATLDLIGRTAIDEQRLPTGEELRPTLLFGGFLGGGIGNVEARLLRAASGNQSIKEGDTRASVEAKVAKQIDDAEKGAIDSPEFLNDITGSTSQEKAKNLIDVTTDEMMKALDSVPVNNLPQHVLMEARGETSAWSKPANQLLDYQRDVLGTKPADLSQQSIADLKASMTGLSSNPQFDSLKLVQQGIKAIDDKEARMGGKAGALVKGEKAKRAELRAEEQKQVNALPKDAGLSEGYTQEYKKITELEAAISQVETLQANAMPSERGKYKASARKLKQELAQARNQLSKEEEMARQFYPANKFAKYVASGGLMAGLPAAYFEDEDGEYSMASGFTIAAGLTGLLMMVALGRSGKNVAASIRRITKDLKKPKVQQGKSGEVKVDTPDQPRDWHESKVASSYTRPYQHSNWKTTKGNIKEFTGHILSPLSRRAKNLEMIFARGLQDVDRKINVKKRDLKIRSLFMYAMQDAAKSGDWFDAYRLAYGKEGAASSQAMQELFTQNKKAVIDAARKLAKRQGIKNADSITIGFGEGSGDYTYSMYRNALDESHTMMGEAGMDVGYREEFNPRNVRDYKQLREYLESQGAEYKSVIDAALQDYAKKHKIQVDDISEFEEAQIVSRLFAETRRREAEAGFTKGRVFTELDENIIDAYDEPGHSLSSYYDQVVEKVEARKFLGKGLTGRYDTGMQKIDDSLAGQLAQNLGKEYGIETPDQLRELQYIIQKRFNSEPSDPLVQMWKNSNYFTTIANIGTTITQLMDLVNTFYFAGGNNTFKSLMRKGKRDWFNEMGLDRSNGVDFGATAGGVNRVLDNILTLTGFNQVDKWAKNVSLEALYKKYKNEARIDPGQLTADLTGEFGADRAQAIVKQLQEWPGGIDGVTPTPPEIQQLLFAKASDFLPLSRSEMPGAAEGKFAPLFYQLKAYTVKQIDIYREINQGQIQKAVRLLGQKKYKEAAEVAEPAVRGLALYGFMLAAAGASTDMIKDAMYGRPVELGDTVKNNLVRLALINRYHMYRMERDGVGKALLDFAMPATTTIDRVSKDIGAFVQGEDLKGHALQGTILDPIYWGFEGFGGYEKVNR